MERRKKSDEELCEVAIRVEDVTDSMQLFEKFCVLYCRV